MLMEDTDFADWELIAQAEGRGKGKMNDKGIVKEVEDALPELPEHIIYCILMKLPARDLHNKFRFICKSWYGMISSNEFISQNAINGRPELLIQVACSRSTKSKLLVEVEEEENGFKLCEFDMKPVGRIRPGCHGLHLVNAPRQKGVMHVLNPLTKFILTLPRCPSYCPHEACGSALAYDPASNRYKVVHVYNATFGFEIFDLGCSDGDWKRIPGPFQVYDQPYRIDFSWSDPVSVNGQVLHWCVSSCEFIISMDVSDERFIRTRLPDCDKKICEGNYALIEMDGCLSFVHTISFKEIDVWILKDFHGQVWLKKHGISTESVTYPPLKDSSFPREYQNDLPDLRRLVAVGCLRNGEVIVFKLRLSKGTGVGFYLYDMKRRVLRKFNMKTKAQQYFIPHRSGLVSLKSEEQQLA